MVVKKINLYMFTVALNIIENNDILTPKLSFFIKVNDVMTINAMNGSIKLTNKQNKRFSSMYIALAKKLIL